MDECPLLGRTGHAGMTRMTRMTPLRKSECATWDDGAAILSIRHTRHDHPTRRFCCHVLCWATTDTREQLQAPPHKHSEKLRPVSSIASTIEHIGESRLGARDQACIRPAIGTQTPWHDISLAAVLIGTSRSISCPHLQKVAGVCFTD